MDFEHTSLQNSHPGDKSHRLLPSQHWQKKLGEVGSLDNSDWRGPQELTASNLLPSTPSPKHEAQQKERYLGIPLKSHQKWQNPCQAKTIHHVYDVIAHKGRVQMWMMLQSRTKQAKKLYFRHLILVAQTLIILKIFHKGGKKKKFPWVKEK